MYLLLYFGGQFFLEFTRGDEAIYLGPWRLAQVLDLIIALLAAAGVLALWWQDWTKPAETDEPQGLEETESSEKADGSVDSDAPADRRETSEPTDPPATE
jgi:hypothetical protein